MTQYAYDPVGYPAKESNGLGLAGFICSLAGLILSMGFLCPVGLVLSLVALGRRPRGFAIAGVLIGLLGTCAALFVFAAIVMGVAGLAAALGFLILTNPEKAEMGSDMVTIAIAAEKYRQENKYLPASLSLLSLEESTLKDPWGEAYRYDLIDPKDNFDIVSSGKDKVFDTLDDNKLSEFGKNWFPDESIRVAGTGDGGNIKVEAGGNKIEVTGDQNGGKVQIKVGDKVINVTGDDEGGSVNVGSGESQPASAPQPPPATP